MGATSAARPATSAPRWAPRGRPGAWEWGRGAGAPSGAAGTAVSGEARQRKAQGAVGLSGVAQRARPVRHGGDSGGTGGRAVIQHQPAGVRQLQGGAQGGQQPGGVEQLVHALRAAVGHAEGHVVQRGEAELVQLHLRDELPAGNLLRGAAAADAVVPPQARGVARGSAPCSERRHVRERLVGGIHSGM